MKKSDEMKNKLESLKTDAQAKLDGGKLEDAKAKIEEIKALKSAIALQEVLESEEHEELAAKAKETLDKTRMKESANLIRAMLKKVTGKRLTEAENALLLPSVAEPTGENGEAYILPEDVRTLIHQKLRDYSSMRSVVGYMPAAALTGSFPIENFETVSELIDFTDGTDGELSDDIKFTNVKYALKEKAAFIKLSNTLLALTDNNLIAYVVQVFAKKAVLTENKLIIAALKKDKTAKPLDGWKGLKSSLNVDIDPAAAIGSVIVTNQDGFDYLDSQLDSTGRPILQPDPSNATAFRFKGLPVHVFSNTLLASVADAAPVFYGNLKEGVSFVDLQGRIAFATSSEAGFLSNTTIARLIEFIDVIQVDKSDKCYCYGTLDLT